MKKFILTLLLFSFLFQGQAQKFDYENNSKFFIGLNIGRVWHTSDVQRVKDKFPLGGGFLIGRTFNSDYGRLFTYDLRLRYLGGNWYGQDTDTTSSFQQNTAASAIYDSIGTMVQNFKSTQHRVAIELALHINRLRDNTGIDPYIFAGIGVTATKTSADYINTNLETADGIPYDYTNFSDEVNTDDAYETMLDKNDAGDAYNEDQFTTRILPSLGFGIGYYFNDRFSMGFEHKSTFVSDDYFDGTTLNQNGAESSRFKNDIYHYTSIYFTWHLRNKASRSKNNNPRTNTPPPPPADEVVPPVEEDDSAENDREDAGNPPEVNFTNPSSSPYTTNSPTYTLRATVKNVASSKNMYFQQNGNVTTEFSFNPMTKRFQSVVQLNQGQNVFTLKGVNDFGNDVDQTILVFRQSVIDTNTALPPTVTITDPVSAPKTVRASTYKVKATIKNVSTRNQLEVIFNGKPLSAYRFSTSGTSNFEATLNLKSGLNTLKIVGNNTDGSDEDETRIVYKEKTTLNPPVVDFINPADTRITVSSPAFNLKGTIKKVADRSDVEFSNNGVLSNDFSFKNYTAQFDANVILSPGQNIFQIVGTNEAGTDEDIVVIQYNVERPKPPVVVITNPSKDPMTTTQGQENIMAKVLNVERKSDVHVYINKTEFTQFTFNAVSKKVSFNASLIAGTNTVKITASNAAGQASDDTKIIYRKPITKNPPKVTFVQPSQTGTFIYTATYQMKALVENVNKVSGIELFFNGKSISTRSFTFNPSTHMISFTTELNMGSNSFIVRGTNTDGSDVANTKIIRKRRVIADPQIDADIEKDPVDDPDLEPREDKKPEKPNLERKPDKRKRPTVGKEEKKPTLGKDIRKPKKGGRKK